MKAYITNMAYYLPEIIEFNEDIRLRKKTGIQQRHICKKDVTAADMAVLAAEKLFNAGVAREKIDFLLFCTQSPDYPLPSTACILQKKLGLANNCGALDFNLGCSGFVYGLGMAKGLIESGQAKQVLLLTSETYSKYINPKDNAVRNLFGDAATATLLSGLDTELLGVFGNVFGTDGGKAKELIVPVGGMRYRYSETAVSTTEDKFGNIRTNQNLYMNGGAITDFTLDIVPKVMESILLQTHLKKEDIDYYVFHQANKFILKSLQQVCGLLNESFWIDVTEYGNTVSNTIPIALVDLMQSCNSKKLKKVLLIGFGVGLSWGGCVVDLSNSRIAM